MQWHLNNISEVLNASTEVLQDLFILNFKDSNFSFSLQIQPQAETVILAADPDGHIGMPLFEYSCNCNIIKVIDSPYDSKTKAIYFFENKDTIDQVRLALNLRPDGNWYIWCNIWKRNYVSNS